MVVGNTCYIIKSMKLNINLLKNMKHRVVINATPNYSPPQEEVELVEKVEIDNPYPDAVADVKSGKIDPLAPSSYQLEQEENIKVAKDAVKNMLPSNATRKAVEALAKAVGAK